MKAYREIRGIAPVILILGSSGWGEWSVLTWPLYPEIKSPRYQLNTRLVRPQMQSRRSRYFCCPTSSVRNVQRNCKSFLRYSWGVTVYSFVYRRRATRRHVPGYFTLLSLSSSLRNYEHYERRDAYRVLVGKPEGRRPLERPRRRWEDNIKMDFREVGWGHGLDRPGSG